MLNILKHPLTRDLDVDDPRTTQLRRQIIRQKPFLQKIYRDWYGWIATRIPHGQGRVLELGSGAGFLDEYIAGLITTEVFPYPFVRLIMDGRAMPCASGSLKAIVMVDVFHHINDCEAFLEEAQRCLRPGGVILMVEPWVTAWSSLVYGCLHHENLDPVAKKWSFPTSGPLSGANSALPWIVFERDRERLESAFQHLHVEYIAVERPFTYLLSGGVSYRSFMPGFLYPAWSAIESFAMFLSRDLGMFAKIEVTRRD
ncbi:MAG TPA: methyltransferase domain-containing protein [Deltaproteobacteria bacterium]|nr:methyltransferase domain-containing protein [Deltaproteobacteria bacterium]HPR52129.1 methyltransferase domain-containing protein [Deltaproteobacteria bacterium]